MGLLTAFFKEPVEITRELTQEEELLHQDLKKFLHTYMIKQNVLSQLLAGGSIYPYLDQLKYALADELKVIKHSEKEEKEIIYDLKYLSKESYIKRVDELFHRVKTIQSNDMFVYKLLEEIQDVLVSEAHKLHRLLKGERNDSIVESVKDLFLIERHLVEKLSRVENFEHLFKEIYLGELRESQVSKIEKRFVDTILEKMQNVTVGDNGLVKSTDGHYISELTATIFNQLHDTIMEAVQSGKIDQHPGVDFEFVNSRYFEDFIRSEITIDKNAGKMIPSERTMRTFVMLFRQLYNAQATPPKTAFTNQPLPTRGAVMI